MSNIDKNQERWKIIVSDLDGKGKMINFYN